MIGESIDFGVWVCDPEGRNTYVSESFLKLIGKTQAEVSEFGWKNNLHPDDAEATIAAWKECVRTGGPSSSGEIRLTTPGKSSARRPSSLSCSRSRAATSLATITA